MYSKQTMSNSVIVIFDFVMWRNASADGTNNELNLKENKIEKIFKIKFNDKRKLIN